MRHDQNSKRSNLMACQARVVTQTGGSDRTHSCGSPELITLSLPRIYPLMKRDSVVEYCDSCLANFGDILSRVDAVDNFHITSTRMIFTA